MSGQLKGEKVFRGIAVSAGVCRGKVLVLHRARHIIARREIPEGDVHDEIRRFEQALVKTHTQIRDVQRRVVQNMSGSEGDIFDAHLLMLEDRVVIDEVIKLIREQKTNADFAFHTVSDRYVAAMEQVEDEYLRERAADMRDLSGRVLDNLLPDRRLRVSPRIVKRAISKYQARGPNINRRSYQATLSINILAGPGP